MKEKGYLDMAITDTNKDLLQYGQANVDVTLKFHRLTLYKFLELTLVVQSQSFGDLVSLTGLSYRTLQNASSQKPSASTYKRLADSLGIDQAFLESLPINMIGKQERQTVTPADFEYESSVKDKNYTHKSDSSTISYYEEQSLKITRKDLYY